MVFAGLDETNTAGKRYNHLSRYFWRRDHGQKAKEDGRQSRKGHQAHLLRANLRKRRSAVEEADALYREIRVENVVTDEKGGKASLKPGAEVDVIIEADSDATTKKPENS